jgi:hypothetical protein
MKKRKLKRWLNSLGKHNQPWLSPLAIVYRKSLNRQEPFLG